MRAMILVVAIIFCSPLWAEETADPFANLPMSFSGEYGSRTSYFRIDNQIFHLRMTHNGEFFSQVDMDFAIFSPGEECLDDNLSGGVTATYPRAPGGTAI